MRTDDHTIIKLRNAKVLTDNGLDLTPLKGGAGPSVEMTTALAIIWEVARRYNTTYRVPTPPTHRWVFENPDCWNEEALWLAHDVIRDWSDLSQKWLPDLQDRKPAGSPIRHGLRTEEERGILSWMNGNFVRTVYKCVRYLILISGDLCDHVDIDPNFVMRRYYIKRGESIPARFEYKPLQKPQFEIVIGPTNLPADSGGCAISNQEGDEIQPPDELTMKDIEDWGYEIFLEEKAIKRRFSLFLTEPLDQKYPSGDTTLVGSPASTRTQITLA